MADWSPTEVELAVADYFSMLSEELSGVSYNKTAHRNELMKLINRNDGSVEFKHQNISAVLVKLGLPYIKGYKPRANYQGLLEERVIEYVGLNRRILEPKFIQFSQESPILKASFDFENIIESPPDKKLIQELAENEVEYKRRPIKRNYLELEQQNSSLGMLGEEFVLQYEKWQLISLGKEALADKIVWIAKDDDGAGFDILSKNVDGTDKYIEVKTTKLTKETPIFFSANEYEFSKEKSKNYNLYRLFNFSSSPRMFTVKGSFDEFCTKEATQYRGLFQK